MPLFYYGAKVLLQLFNIGFFQNTFLPAGLITRRCT